MNYHLSMKIYLRTLTIEDKQDIFDYIYHDEKIFEAFLGKPVENIEDFHFDRMLEYFKNNACFYYGIELLEYNKLTLVMLIIKYQ